MTTPSLRALPVLDLLATDEGAAALVRRGERAELVRLSPLGAAVRELAEQVITLEALMAELERRFGAPPDGDLEEATMSAATSLVEIGLAEWVTD